MKTQRGNVKAARCRTPRPPEKYRGELVRVPYVVAAAADEELVNRIVWEWERRFPESKEQS